MQSIVYSLIGYTSLMGIAAWLCRTWIKERLTASIRLETETKITNLKSELEATTQRVRDVTSAGNAATAQVESTLLEYRIDAVKKVWESVLNWQSVSAATMMVSVFDQSWLEKNASDPGTQSTFEKLLKGSDFPGFMKKQNETEFVRPFLSETTWALYQAYHGFLTVRLTKAWLLAIPGLSHAEMLLRFNERDLVEKSATPEILAVFDKNPYVGTEPYLRFLREKMLVEFREFLSGHRAGNHAIQGAAQIIQAAEALMSASREAIHNPIKSH